MDTLTITTLYFTLFCLGACSVVNHKLEKRELTASYDTSASRNMFTSIGKRSGDTGPIPCTPNLNNMCRTSLLSCQKDCNKTSLLNSETFCQISSENYRQTQAAVGYCKCKTEEYRAGLG